MSGAARFVWSSGCLHGLVCGLFVTFCDYWWRGVDAPVPLFASLILVPYGLIAGFVVGRRRPVPIAGGVGAVTALVNVGLVTVVEAIVTAITEPATIYPIAWILYGVMFLLPIVAISAMCAVVGGALAQSRLLAALTRRR
ncbi:hypothetical protein [Fodinicola acaciae]|uniref:hypothetical protein n=1 Tax=Fodinicola acaciae TaxID=2681555 RepID=UPI0013D5FBA2|nr:hypothetical protein [Fodinicola acaciae]